MLKIYAWFIFSSCITALSCCKLEGFPTSGSQDSNLSEAVIAQGQEIHVLRHAGLNMTVSLEAKKGDKVEYEKKKDIFLSLKSSHRGNGGGGTNIPHRPRQSKNAASSLARPPNFFLPTAMFHVSLAVILACPSLLLKIF